MQGKVHGKVLIVDDEPNALTVLAAILREEGYSVFKAGDAEAAEHALGKEDIDTVITDMKMPAKDGMQLMDFIADRYPDIPVIFLTAYGSVDSAVHAITRGAFYYFIKPPDYAKLKGILARAVEQRGLKRELEALRKRVPGGKTARIVGVTPEMVRIFETIEAVKDSMSSVLISGETGTGKELIARSLHYGSVRRDKPFVAVNCAAMPRELIESELFGYEKGAFSGAFSRRIGRFEEAAEGTIFLDEIGELEMPLQAKLLRVLQEKEIERLGSNKKIKVNFRLISSTNRNIPAEISAGNFREDLYYRLNVVQIQVPPLRDRREDIPLLAAELIREYGAREGKVLRIDDEVMQAFLNYDWPGNIRQLGNIIERAVVLAKKDRITIKELPEDLKTYVLHTETRPPVRTLREIEEEAIRAALEESAGNKSQAAKLLGISRKFLYKRLEEMGQ
ncbi:sigma-54 dependent transcriptional regulator [Geobacter sp.]|uniref:sigma-54-dependent transcriptional regulator n=1 Tax=Geobacter sp. TaxID=46610 RepID=UPI001AC3D9C8|nr:sigma-54 dependent transcriptional regulator [Geobacter sp.]CAG1015646.1 Transcriptional regulatory protein ZraR [Anaerolineales bacterium]